MVRLMVVADIRLYREGLTRLLDSFDGIQVVATAGTGEQALDRILESSPDTLLVDRTVSGSLSLVSKVRTRNTRIKVVILTIEEVEDEVVRCAEAGAHGYVTRNATAAELVATIQAARAGELRCSPAAAGSLLRRVKHLAAKRHPVEALTEREVEVLTCVERGMSNRRISEYLGIEVATVKNHVHNILEKLQVKNRGEAAAVFRRGSNRRRSGYRDLDPEIHV